YPQEVGKSPITGTLAPPLLMQAFAPFGPIAPFLATPLECATLRRSRTFADLHCKGGRICASFRKCHGAVGVCRVSNDEYVLTGLQKYASLRCGAFYLPLGETFHSSFSTLTPAQDPHSNAAIHGRPTDEPVASFGG